MITTMTRPTASQFLSLCLMGLLTLSLIFANSHDVGSLTASSQALSHTVMVETVGADVGGCGILVGAVGAMATVAIAGVTVGLGALLVMSATAHVGAVLCMA